MSELEMVRACAEAMGATVHPDATGRCWWPYESPESGPPRSYDPLHDDAQAFALLDRFCLEIQYVSVSEARVSGQLGEWASVSSDLNRAIVECVAKMQKAITKSAHPSPENTDSV